MLHAAECLRRSRHREYAVRQRAEDPFVDKRRKRRLIAQQPVDVYAGELDVVAEGAKPELAVGVEIALPELDETAKRAKDGKALVDGLARNRIEDDIDPFTAGDLEDLVREGERARIDNMLHPEPAQETALLRRPRGGEDLGTHQLRVLDRGDADTAGRAVYQNPLAALQARDVVERVVDRHGRHGEAGGLLVAHGARFLEEPGRRHGDVRGKGIATEAEYGLSRHEAVDAHTNRHDLPGEFHPHRRARESALEGFLGYQAYPLQHVAEIETRGLDANGDLSGGRRRDLDFGKRRRGP